MSHAIHWIIGGVAVLLCVVVLLALKWRAERDLERGISEADGDKARARCLSSGSIIYEAELSTGEVVTLRKMPSKHAEWTWLYEVGFGDELEFDSWFSCFFYSPKSWCGDYRAVRLLYNIEVKFERSCPLHAWVGYPSSWTMTSPGAACMDAWIIYQKQSDGRGHYLELYQHGTLRAIGPLNEEPDATDDFNRLWQAIVNYHQPQTQP